MKFSGLITAVADVTGVPGKDRSVCEPGAYCPVITAARITGFYPVVRWDHEPLKIGKVVGLEEWYPTDRRLPDHLRQVRAGALVAKIGIRNGPLSSRVWSFVRKNGWLGLSVNITYLVKDARRDAGGFDRVFYVKELTEISATMNPATYRNYVLSMQEAA